MSVEQFLFEHYDGIVDTPEAVSKMRDAILDFAVHGRLVEQDSDDEPASELLERISAERGRLTELIVSRNMKPADSIESTQLPHLIPLNWSWTRIAHLGLINPKNKLPDSLDASFIPMRLIASEYSATSQHEKRLWGKIKKGYTHFAEGDVGLAKITPCFENGKSTIFRNLTGGVGSGTTELHVLRPLIVLAEYVLIFLKRQKFIETGIQTMTGTAGQKRVPLEYFVYSPFPLPPLAEQHRIVAKVDELMDHCDRLDEKFKERENHRKRFSKASFGSLTESGIDESEFEKRGGFVVENFDRLTVDVDQIKNLRQLIIDLAVRGRLVEQSPDDEPIANLLADIVSERDERLKKGEIRTPKKQCTNIEQPPFAVPDQWMWIPMMETGNIFIGDSTNQQTKEQLVANRTGHPYIMTKDVGYGLEPLNYENGMKVSYDNKYLKVARPNTVVICAEGGSAGRKMGISDRKFCFGNKLIANEVWRSICPRFLLFVYMSTYFFYEFSNRMTGVISGVSIGNFFTIPFPLPSFSEQQRIVAKVDDLMGICDALELSAVVRRNQTSELLKILLHKSFD